MYIAFVVQVEEKKERNIKSKAIYIYVYKQRAITEIVKDVTEPSLTYKADIFRIWLQKFPNSQSQLKRKYWKK